MFFDLSVVFIANNSEQLPLQSNIFYQMESKNSVVRMFDNHHTMSKILKHI